jgi:geranylgeranyl diphosphate synthase type I
MMLGGKQSDAMAAAGAVEMIHNFTLTHDDIMDNDDMRHGVPTTHKKFDMPLAILAGDVLYSKAYHTISKSKLSPNYTSQLVSKLSKACIEICEGQVDDIKLAENKRIPTESEYIKMVEKKTAVLFEVACAMGAISAKKPAKDVKNLSVFGRNLGIAFQITDDLIGIMGDSKVTGKAVGNDIREGKKSLPILLAIRKARGSNKKKILRVFGKSKATRIELNDVVSIIRSLGIEETVRKQALRYANHATKALDKYSGVHKSELISLLDFVVKRSL